LLRRASQRRQTRLFQFQVLRFGSDEDGDVRVGVSPKREEILIGRLGFGGVALHGVGAPEAEMSKCSDGSIENNPTMVENFLKFGDGFTPFMGG
jgi:hypothetical protein